MAWIRLDDRITENPKLDEVGPIGSWLHVSAIAYCNRNLTDGRFSKSIVSRLGSFDWSDPETAALPNQLVAKGLWHTAGHTCEQCPAVAEGHLYVHGYLEFQFSRQQVMERRANDAERQRQHREAAQRGANGQFESRRDTTRESRNGSQTTGGPNATPAPASQRDSAPMSRRDTNVTEPVTEADQGTDAPSRRDTASDSAVSRAVPNPTQREIDKDKSLSSAVVNGPRSVTEQGELWDTLMTVCGIDTDGISKSARGAYRKALSELRQMGASPDEVMERAVAYRRRWPEASLTPSALVRHWGECSTSSPVDPNTHVLAQFAAGGQ